MKIKFYFLILITLLFKVGVSQPCSSFEVTTLPKITLPECNDSTGSIVFQNTMGGTSPYSYQLNKQTSQLGSFFELPIGDYQVLITDSRGCEDSIIVSLQYKDIAQIIRPNNAFSPNGDEINDTWFIPSIESLGAADVRVFNRWGQQVYANTSYKNEFGWNGTQNGSKLPPSTYFYVISIINNCVEEYLKGTVTIAR